MDSFSDFYIRLFCLLDNFFRLVEQFIRLLFYFLTTFELIADFFCQKTTYRLIIGNCFYPL